MLKTLSRSTSVNGLRPMYGSTHILVNICAASVVAYLLTPSSCALIRKLRKAKNVVVCVLYITTLPADLAVCVNVTDLAPADTVSTFDMG